MLPMTHLREGLIAMAASHRCTTDTPTPPPPTQARVETVERVVGSSDVLCFHFIFTPEMAHN